MMYRFFRELYPDLGFGTNITNEWYVNGGFSPAILGKDQSRIGRPRANVAMARRLLRILYAMIRDGKAYEGGPKRDRTAAANKARLAHKKQVA